jgi:hypothetical protein
MVYCYKLFGLPGSAAIPAGEHQVRAEFAYDGWRASNSMARVQAPRALEAMLERWKPRSCRFG